MMSYVYILTLSTSLLSIMVIWWSHDTHETNMFKGYHSPWLHHCLYCTYVNDTNWGEREKTKFKASIRSLFTSILSNDISTHFLLFSMSCTYIHMHVYIQIFIAINLDTSLSLLSSSTSFVHFRIILIIRISLSLYFFFLSSCPLLYDVVSQEGVSNLISFRTVVWSTECNYRTYLTCMDVCAYDLHSCSII